MNVDINKCLLVTVIKASIVSVCLPACLLTQVNTHTVSFPPKEEMNIMEDIHTKTRAFCSYAQQCTYIAPHQKSFLMMSVTVLPEKRLLVNFNSERACFLEEGLCGKLIFPSLRRDCATYPGDEDCLCITKTDGHCSFTCNIMGIGNKQAKQASSQSSCMTLSMLLKILLLSSVSWLHWLSNFLYCIGFWGRYGWGQARCD